jgi:hypothetical protein
MPISHYFSILEVERTKRFQKILHYSAFLSNLSEAESKQISQEFYQKFPSDEAFKPLNELLKGMICRQVSPDSTFVEALEDYFIFRIKSAALE